MSTDPRIRVIKLAERKRRAKARIKRGREAARRPEPDQTQGAADTITGWINELRQQKQQSADAASDFNNLFEDAT
jgi:hypothetical protein